MYGSGPVTAVLQNKTEGYEKAGFFVETDVKASQVSYLPVIAPLQLCQVNGRYKLEKVTPSMFPKNEYEAEVVKIVDGDSIHVHIKSDGRDYYVRVRYIGITAPELSHFGKKAEPYSKEATEANRKLVEGCTVKLKLDSRKKYKSGRLLAYVYVEKQEEGKKKEIFVNNYLVRNGFARLKVYPPQTTEDKEIKELLASEKKAKEEKKGLWGIREQKK